MERFFKNIIDRIIVTKTDADVQASSDWADAGGVSVYFPTAGPFTSIPIEPVFLQR